MVIISTTRCALDIATVPVHALDVALASNHAAQIAIAPACSLGIDLVTSGV